ncbi:HAMP domain-containing sensor histidine kinase [Oleispirillum naphthae]|uniref:sensor histidine kinase n=1 Tax=Oleispirillum naphthae TaxID=2838853 RepID=UPI0030824A84
MADDTPHTGEAEGLTPAALAHELRSPLGAIKGFASLIAEQAYGPPGDSRYLDAAAQMLVACRHMESLIDGLLDEARMRRGTDALNETTVDLSEMLATVQSWLSDDIVRTGVVVRARVALRPVLVRGDERRLRQAMLNVLGNAVKFAPRGGHIDIAIAVEAEGGVAISFRNDVAAAAMGAPGTGCGLGLYITRAQMCAHGGDLAVQPTAGGGVLVRLFLPASRRVAG